MLLLLTLPLLILLLLTLLLLLNNLQQGLKKGLGLPSVRVSSFFV